jgi:primosomal protein N' (replication factor Y)
LRASVVGAARTAHELGVAFPGIPVVASSGDQRVHDVPASPVLVVATPGAEPVADGGYATTVALDGDLVLARPGLSAGEQAVSRWTHLAALTRAAPAGGLLVLVADPGAPEVQAVVADSPERYAERALGDRDQARMPPSVSAAVLTGDEDPVRAAAAWARGEGTLDLDLHLRVGVEAGDLEVLGPAPLPGTSEQVRLLLLGSHADVASAVRELARRRAGAGGRLTVRVDPTDL